MKKLSLQAFEKPDPAFSINFFYEAKNSLVDFKFQILGDLSQVEFLENNADPLFTKNLWKHTCAEVFVRNKDACPYFEWNFGLNSHWWAAEFSSYRKVRKERDDLFPISQEKYVSKKNDEMIFMSSLDLSKLGLQQDAQFHPSFVLKSKKGPKIHWALQHLSQQPDFHQAENFKELLFL